MCAQVKSSEIKEKMGEAQETEKEIEARSNEYRPVAKRASLLYFCLADLAVVRAAGSLSPCPLAFFSYRRLGAEHRANNAPMLARMST